jgi:hypothetical protein
MKRLIKKGIDRIFFYAANLFKVDIYSNLTKFYSYIDIIENKYGHGLSRESCTSCGIDFEPLPWFTYPAIEFINQLDLSNCDILEWGIGNSTLYFGKRAREVFSIENDRAWFERIVSSKLNNNHIFLEENLERYVKTVTTFNKKFDIIIIDGKERKACSEICHFYLNDNGLVILDNSDRNPEIAEYFRKMNLLEVDMHGFGPINDYSWTTSFFFKRTAYFKPIANQPVIPIGGGF